MENRCFLWCIVHLFRFIHHYPCQIGHNEYAMPEICYQGRIFQLREDETILAGLLRQGVELEYSCRAGVCNACIIRATAFDPDLERLKTGTLAPNLVASGHFLPCKTRLKGSIELLDPAPGLADNPVYARTTVTGLVVGKRWLTDDIVQLHVQPSVDVIYKAGQFVWLYHSDGQARPYSLACSPQRRQPLEFHIRRHDQGHVSRWITDELTAGTDIALSLADGDCCLEDGMNTVVMVAFGAGLAPMAGISQQILDGGEAAVGGHLLHVAHGKNGLYGESDSWDLAGEIQASASMQYTGLESRSELFTSLASLNSRYCDAYWFLCGSPDAVYQSRDELLRLGIPEGRMRFDPFESQPLVALPENDECQPDYPDPQPELWAWLNEDNRLATIVADFYLQIFADPILSPYFENITRRRSREKVFSFYQRVFSGEPSFFGDRPDHAHHWMVHSDDIFDYQLLLMEQTLKNHEMPGLLITIWMSYEEYFRRDIIKTRPEGY
tara:strand:- start:1101 stop:2588 length:1488 start_codon:yes stop_codon:yes gene_type:complete